LDSWREAIEIEHGSAVHDGVADLDDTPQPDQAFPVDLIPAEQIGVVTESRRNQLSFHSARGVQ
jgi:hypothetical protein